MNIYLARQPIYDQYKNIRGYEFLYRSSDKNRYIPTKGEEDPTIKLISHMIVDFNLNELTRKKPAFINCSQSLLLSDVISLMDPKKFVLEILEDTVIDETVINRIIELKNLGYLFAIDDYTGQADFDPIMEYMDYIKVDYLLTTESRRRVILSTHPKKLIVAEKVETKEDYIDCTRSGFKLFQGYYFSKPLMLTKGTTSIATHTHLEIWHEVTKDTVGFNRLSNLIYKDAGLAYKILSKMKTMRYYRGNDVKSIRFALVMMGINEIKRWMMLVLMGGLSSEINDKYIMLALTRAIFAESLVKEITQREVEEDAYIAGLFSIFDTLFKDEFASMLDQLLISEAVKEGLLNGEGLLGDIVSFIKAYEEGTWENVEPVREKYNLDSEKITNIYFKALLSSEKAFR